MACCLGIDIGTTKIVALVWDEAARRIVAAQEEANDTETTSPADKARGRREWDADAMIERALACAAVAVAKAGTAQIDGIGVTGQMHGMVLLGRDGKPLTPFINWQDQRCEEQDADGAKTMELFRRAAGPEGLARTGCVPATGYMAATLYWMKKHDINRLRAPGAQAAFIMDVLVSRLTGMPPLTDPTNAGAAGVFDVAARRWDEELIGRLGLPLRLFPPVRSSGSIAGPLGRDAAARLGLREGTPVAVACGDNQAGFLGSVRNPRETALVNVGTGAQVSVWTGDPLCTAGIDTRCHVDGGWLLVGAPLCGGASYALLRNFLAQAAALAGADTSALDYEALSAAAMKVPPGADGLRCVPLFTGTRESPDARASFTGITPANFTPGHLARAALEGVADQLLAYYRRMANSGAAPRTRLIGSGNGIRRNPLLRDILSAAFGMPLTIAEHVEEAAVGAALLARQAIGAK